MIHRPPADLANQLQLLTGIENHEIQKTPDAPGNCLGLIHK